jgi:hypothetical protein
MLISSCATNADAPSSRYYRLNAGDDGCDAWSVAFS